MKKIVTILALAVASISMAQTKSTGIVTLISGMTAQLDLNNATTTATLTLTGPADRWFALAFKDSFPVVEGEPSGMGVGNDLVWYNGTTLVDAVQNGTGEEPTDDTTNNWTVVTNTEAGGVRTIVATRPFNTGDSQDFTFDYADTDIDFAAARRTTASYSLGSHGGNRDVFLNNTLTETMGVGDVNQLSKIKLAPNPANETFSIQSQKEIQSIKIYDMSGKHVMSAKATANYNISNLPQGVYFVEVLRVDGQSSLEKLIKH